MSFCNYCGRTLDRHGVPLTREHPRTSLSLVKKLAREASKD